MPKKDDEARAEVEKEAMERQEENQRKDMARTQKALEDQRLQAQLRRQEEERREDAEIERADKKTAELKAQRAVERETAKAREDQIRRENEERMTRTVEQGRQELERQAGVNREDASRRVNEHQNVLKNVTGQIGDTEKKTADLLIRLTEQKRKDQEKLHAEKEGYNERELSEKKEHHGKIEELKEKQTTILEEREENKERHGERLFLIRNQFEMQKVAIGMGAASDRKEISFADAVNNTRSAGSKVSSKLSPIGALAIQSKRVDGVGQKTVDSNIRVCNDALTLIIALSDNAQHILNCTESNNAVVIDCQNRARDISTAAMELNEAVLALLSDLTYNNEACFAESTALVQQRKKELFDLTNKLPVVPRSDHQLNAIMSSVRAIGGSSCSIGTKSVQPTIEN